MKCTEDHERIDIENDIATIGMTDFAQQQLINRNLIGSKHEGIG